MIIFVPRLEEMTMNERMDAMQRQRLESLDVLRGFDFFCLVGLEAVMHALDGVVDAPWFDRVMWCFTHVDWEGFSSWDLVMPLFMFMSGVTIPFALARYKREGNKGVAYRRIIKRVLLLWLFGMICQGNLLGLDPDRVYLYSNTLQSIAVGYLVASLLYLNSSVKVQIGVAAGLLLAFWGSMEWIQVGEFGGGNYTPTANLAEWVDRTVLGRFRDGAIVEGGQVVFASWYHYTWVLSSLTFVVTTMTGMFAGYILKDSARTPLHKYRALVLIGVALVAGGWLWGLQMPVIKKLWTSSMVLVSSGYCFLLMALFYWIIDCKAGASTLASSRFTAPTPSQPICWLRASTSAAYLAPCCMASKPTPATSTPPSSPLPMQSSSIRYCV